MPVKMILGFLVSLTAVMIAMPPFIKYLKKLSFKQSVSIYALADDRKKAGTPIMGGILFIIVPILVSIISSPQELTDLDTWIVILAFAGYGLIGFIDDYLIAIKKNNDGLTPMKKLFLQILLAVVFFVIYRSHAELAIAVPFVDHPVPLGWGYFILILVMFAGSSNAVNLTDGMDGLASGVSILALIPYVVICAMQGRIGLSVLTCSLLGALFGYLYYNKKPARVFMGDTGSLALGGILAGLAMITKTELLLIIIAGVPVLETVCVIIQQIAVRTVHHKVFVYTPVHYAFRIKGVPEKTVVILFWIAEALFAGLGMLIYLYC